jgi:hypothetical protein
LITVRRASPALMHGTTRIPTTSRDDVFAWLREDGTDRVLVVASFATSDVTPTIDLASLGITSAKAKERIFGAALPDVTPSNASAYTVPMAKASTIWISLE